MVVLEIVAAEVAEVALVLLAEREMVALVQHQVLRVHL
jgi:hypothetical protein